MKIHAGQDKKRIGGKPKSQPCPFGTCRFPGSVKYSLGQVWGGCGLCAELLTRNVKSCRGIRSSPMVPVLAPFLLV